MSTQDNVQHEPLPQVRLQNCNWPLSHWLSDSLFELYDLDAPYQRGAVWTLEQRQNLIRSLYMGVPVGSTIVSTLPYRKDGKLARVVDGKQRILAVRAFAQGEFPVPAWWFRPGELRPEAAGRADVSWSDLSDGAQFRFETGAPLPALEFNGQVEYLHKDAKGNWVTRNCSDAEILAAEAELFELINFHGTPQTEVTRERARRVARDPDAYLP